MEEDDSGEEGGVNTFLEEETGEKVDEEDVISDEMFLLGVDDSINNDETDGWQDANSAT